jgi:hypothetical protein
MNLKTELGVCFWAVLRDYIFLKRIERIGMVGESYMEIRLAFPFSTESFHALTFPFDISK